MARCLLSVGLVLFAFAAQLRAEERVDFVCPLYVLFEDPPNKFWQCDRYEGGCEDPEPEVAYLYGPNYEAYTTCGGPECVAAAKDNDKNKPNIVFPGLTKKVPVDYVPVPREKEPPVQGIPPRQTGVGYNEAHDCHFIKFKVEGKDKVYYAKVIESRSNRKLIQNPRGTSDADAGYKWRSSYIAFECEDVDEEEFDVHRVAELVPLPGGANNAYAGRIETEIGESSPVLILLAR